MFRTILESHLIQFGEEGFLVYVQVLAESIQRGIVIPEFHIDEAEKHHRVVR